MDEGLLREIATTYLVPLFSGTSLKSKALKSTSREGLVSFLDPLSIAFKAKRSDNYRLVLTRRQSFASTAQAVVPEFQVVKAFAEIIGDMAEALESQMKSDLLSTFQRRVVAQAVGISGDKQIILSGIDQLTGWGSRLYEGAPVSVAIGFRNTQQEGDVISLNQIAENDFGAVLGNGYDTLLEFNFSGQLLRHRALRSRTKLPSFCPVRQASIADWTTKNWRRVALTLNRLSEILVIRNQELLFTRRSGKWHFLTHAPVISQMAVPKDRLIRTAIYETCLDASFSRTGACIGVVDHAHQSKWHKLVDDADRLNGGGSVKARAISKMVGGKNFHKLDRRLRQELSAIDGATVLSHTGEVLAVGAILNIRGGSTGGGRLAAAKALSRMGLGIKVSQDGEITGFRNSKTGPAFRVM